MSVSTLRPTGTTSNTGTLTGGATAHAVLADNSDSSYVTFDEDEGCAVTLGDFTLPADAVVKSVGWRLRTSGGWGQVVQSNLLSGVEVAVGQVVATWTSATTVTIRSGVTEFTSGVEVTDALIDAASLSATNSSTVPFNVYEAYVDVTYVDQPVVGVGTPTGTVSTDTSPTVTWLQSIDSAGGNVTAFEVKVYTDAQYGAGGFSPDTSEATIDSGTVADNTPNGANVWDLPEPLDDDTYRAYVRVRQTVNGEDHWSDWDFEGFVIDALRPGTPTLTLTPEDSSARMLIEIEQGDQERVNIVTNPKAGTATTNWANTSLTTFERVTSLPSGAPSGVTTGLHIVGNANGDNAGMTLTTVAAATYRASIYLRISSLSATNVSFAAFEAFTSLGAVTITTVGASLVRYSFTFTATDTSTSLLVAEGGAGAMDITFTAVLVEEDPGSLEAYFDGDNDNSAWTGTEELSTSAQGTDTDLFYIERSDDGGGSWTEVRTGHASGAAFLEPTAGEASVYDYEGPNGVAVSYRATAVGVTSSDPLTLVSSAPATDSAIWEDDAIWLKDPANPELNVRIP